MKKLLALIVIVMLSYNGFSQDDDTETKSNVQEFTPSKLLSKGQWDIKVFAGLYTQTERTDGESKSVTIDRENFFTNTNEIYTGVSDNARINVGLIFQTRANTYAGQGALSVFNFENNGIDSRSGVTTIAPSIRVQPFPSIANFSFTSSIYIPVFEDRADAVYLDKRSYFWETKFFYDKTFGGNKWQVFTELDLGFNFGESRKDAITSGESVNIGERFANNSLFLPVSAFLSYFPSSKSTIFVNTQQAFLIGYDNPGSDDSNFSQNSTAFGLGGKYQLTNTLNVEASVNKIVRGQSFQGLGQTFSLGLRVLL